MMLRTKFIAVLVVGLVALLLGTAVAYAGWSWNAVVKVENTKIRTAWTVTDDPDGATSYSTDIVVALPEGTKAKIKEVAPSESVELVEDDSLSCTSSGIEASVAYTVSAADAGAVGEEVWVAVTTKKGDILAEGAGTVAQTIVVEAVIPSDKCDEDDD